MNIFSIYFFIHTICVFLVSTKFLALDNKRKKVFFFCITHVFSYLCKYL